MKSLARLPQSTLFLNHPLKQPVFRGTRMQSLIDKVWAPPRPAAVAPQEELPLPLEHFLQRMARRPRPQQFFGLMGKRDAGEQGGGLGHKTDSFVGLMGKRSLNSGMYII
uniref:Tachykinin precursor 1 n=1 Tax=Athene cunicularia TaxID=194338 RepID=A0A663LN24_ATHCN